MKIKMILAIAFVLVLSGCATTVEERFDIAMVCQTDKEADCSVEWLDYESGIAAAERRTKADHNPCGKGYLLYCNHVCNMTKKHGEVAGVCVTQKTFTIY